MPDRRPPPQPHLRHRAPDERDRLRARVWECGTCGHQVVADEPVPVPAPCPTCRGIVFKVIGPNRS
jgi:rubrerythrin